MGFWVNDGIREMKNQQCIYDKSTKLDYQIFFDTNRFNKCVSAAENKKNKKLFILRFTFSLLNLN